jgi:hypothetical protein
MLRMRSCFLALALVLSAPAMAEPLVMAQGLAIEPADELDLTYQVVESYDQTEKVLAGWRAEDLQYFITIEKLSPGLLDARTYFAALMRDLKSLSAEKSLAQGRKGSYHTPAGLEGSYLEYTFRMRDSREPSRQVAHFLTDGKSAFVTISTALDEDFVARMFDDSVAIFKTASFQEVADTAPPAKNEDTLAGKWTATVQSANGQTVVTHLELESNLSFSGRTTIDGKPSSTFSGLWSLSGKRLSWDYLDSRPAMPEAAKSDKDMIESFDGKELVVVSRRTGEKRTFRREE